MGIVKTKDLTFEYIRRDEEGNVEGITTAVDHVNIDLQAGQFIAVLGHNGSGKSTLAKHFNALVSPTEGTVWVDGMDTKEDEKILDIRQTAGMVFQNPDNQIICTLVEEEVGFGPENIGVPTDEIWQRVADSLQAVGMYSFRKASPNKLSGGQKQRVAIAGVLAVRPKIIIFDESTSMLDPEGKRDIVGLMRRLNDEENFTIISITHDIDEASLADRVIVLNDGRVIDDDVPGKIFASGDLLTKIGLDLPYPEALKEELKEKGIDVPNEYLDEEGMVDWLCRSALKN